MPSTSSSRGCARWCASRCSGGFACNGGARRSPPPMKAAWCAHDVVEGLSAAIRAHRPDRAGFEALIDAREADLEAPPADLAALEAYAQASSGRLCRLAAELLGAGEPEALAAADEVGTGYALAGLIRAMPFHAAAGRRYIAADAVPAVVRAAEAHLAAARARRRAVPRPVLA